MISKALQFTGNVLDKFLQSYFGTEESRVVLNNPVAADGSVPEQNRNKVLLSLVNVDRHALKKAIAFGYKGATAQGKEETKTDNYSVYILASTSFADYVAGLDHLDAVITFFTDNPVFDKATHPEMPGNISKIDVLLEPADGVHMRSIWLAMGAKYQPSVVYKISVTLG